MDFREISKRMKVAMFDMDGTLVDSMQQWRVCNVVHLESFGVKLSDEDRPYIIQASSGVMLFDYVKKRYGIDLDRAKLTEIQRKQMYDTYVKGVPVKPGVIDYLTYLRGRGVKVVLTTATWATHTVLALSQNGLLPYFDAIYTCDVVGCSKAKPEYFDKVSELIGYPKDECVLFEDALYAIRSGRSAGLLGTVALADPTNTLFRDDMQREADIFVETMAELPR